MSVLDLNFQETILLLLNEIAEGSAIFALKSGEQAYYVDGVIKEIENKTEIGEQFAKVILGTAIEIAIREREQANVIKEAELSADKFLKKYLNIKLPDCV